jgi:hypothetical protein
MKLESLFLLIVILSIGLSNAAKGKKAAEDPRDCEVCVSNLEQIEKLIPAESRKDTAAIEKAIGYVSFTFELTGLAPMRK